jgi:glutathione peroxidase
MPTALYDIPVRTIEGGPTSLAAYKGNALLIVNVASKCGLTPQYAGLESLYERFHDQGLLVLGFPANDFMGQEPGSNAEIVEFCRTNYDVTFPLFEKIAVTGDEQHPLYQYLTQAAPQAREGSTFEEKLKGFGVNRKNPSDILWNFEKFVVDRNGTIVARFAPDTAPDAPALIAAIEAALATTALAPS